jgi:ABC-2 type transport system permease protein/lipopolysaccharide transport system permease protein
MVYLASSGASEDMPVEWTGTPTQTAMAWQDLAGGVRRYWLWTELALQDIRLRYRGSVLGPFWLTISMLIMVIAMGFIYAQLFHTDTRTYLPYLAIGLIVWQLVSTMVTDGCQTFLGNEAVIQQVPIPFSIHAFRVVCRNFIIFAHNLAIIPVGLLVFWIPVDWHLLEAGLGCLLLAVNGVWISLLLGILCARFRDIGPIVANFLQVIFFLTPIFWLPDVLGDYWPVAEFNPLFAAIDVIRGPLTGVPIHPYSWPVLLVMNAVGTGAAFLLFVRFRGRIAYWI